MADRNRLFYGFIAEFPQTPPEVHWSAVVMTTNEVKAVSTRGNIAENFNWLNRAHERYTDDRQRTDDIRGFTSTTAYTRT